jgi:predicted alpha-1,2-mannosidase
LQFDRPFTAAGGWDGTTVSPPGTSINLSAPHAGGYLTFDTRTNPTVHAKVAISYVSTAGAEQNMSTEIPGWDLAPVEATAQTQWSDALSHVQVGGGTTAELRTFYTALYHSLLYPTTFSDVDGRYIGFDSTIHTLSGSQHVQYANYSLWDTYRCLAALQALLLPNVASDLAQSLVNDAEQFGWLPKWPVANGESGVMDGDNVVPFLASLYAFGATNFDTGTALQYMLKGATTPAPPDATYLKREGVADYQNYGYVPNDRAEKATCASARHRRWNTRPTTSRSRNSPARSARTTLLARSPPVRRTGRTSSTAVPDTCARRTAPARSPPAPAS